MRIEYEVQDFNYKTKDPMQAYEINFLYKGVSVLKITSHNF